MKISGIYIITNTVNDKAYIGSSVDIHKRWKRHLKDLKANKHHSIILQRAWNKYGEKSFTFSVLEKCSEENLLNEENYYFKILKPEYNTYLVAGSPLGSIRSEEAITKNRNYALVNNLKPPLQPTKRVTMLDYNTSEELVTFESITDACKSVGKDFNYASAISNVCNGIRKSAFKFKWKWA